MVNYGIPKFSELTGLGDGKAELIVGSIRDFDQDQSPPCSYFQSKAAASVFESVTDSS